MGTALFSEYKKAMFYVMVLKKAGQLAGMPPGFQGVKVAGLTPGPFSVSTFRHRDVLHSFCIQPFDGNFTIFLGVSVKPADKKLVVTTGIYELELG
jgi:hypothetical protein